MRRDPHISRRFHELAAHAHRVAAVHHEKEEDMTGTSIGGKHWRISVKGSSSFEEALLEIERRLRKRKNKRANGVLMKESVNSWARGCPFARGGGTAGSLKSFVQLPIPNFRHVLKMLPDVRMVLVQFPVEHVDCVRRLRAQSGHMLERVDGQVEAAHLVEHDHVEWSGRRPVVIESAHVKSSLVRTAMHHAMNEPAIAMKREDHVYFGVNSASNEILSMPWG